MRIATSPDFLQSVSEHPKVWKWLVQDDTPQVHLSAIFAEGIGMEYDDGGFFFHDLGDGVVESHAMFLPHAVSPLDKAQGAITHLFCNTPCHRIVARIAADNVPADRFVQGLGARPDRVVRSAWLRNGAYHDVKHYSLVMDDWLITQDRAALRFADPGKGARALRRFAIFHGRN